MLHASKTVAPARLSSTMLLLARNPPNLPLAASRGYEYKILFVRRSARMPQLPHRHIFPGGVIETNLEPPPGTTFATGLTRSLGADSLPHWSVLRMLFDPLQKGPRDGASLPLYCPVMHDRGETLANRIGAIRELFEESGILLSNRAAEVANESLRVPKASSDGRLGPLRHATLMHPGNFVRVISELNMLPRVDCLVPFANWITPTTEARRFDTWFYMTAVQEDWRQLSFLAHHHNPHELDANIWMSPEEALEMAEADDLVLAPPTFYFLKKLLPLTSIIEAVRFARSQIVQPCLPQVISDQWDNQVVVALPGDHAHDPNEDPRTLIGDWERVQIVRRELRTKLDSIPDVNPNSAVLDGPMAALEIPARTRRKVSRDSDHLTVDEAMNILLGERQGPGPDPYKYDEKLGEDPLERRKDQRALARLRKTNELIDRVATARHQREELRQRCVAEWEKQTGTQFTDAKRLPAPLPDNLADRATEYGMDPDRLANDSFMLDPPDNPLDRELQKQLNIPVRGPPRASAMLFASAVSLEGLTPEQRAELDVEFRPAQPQPVLLDDLGNPAEHRLIGEVHPLFGHPKWSLRDTRPRWARLEQLHGQYGYDPDAERPLAGEIGANWKSVREEALSQGTRLSQDRDTVLATDAWRRSKNE